VCGSNRTNRARAAPAREPDSVGSAGRRSEGAEVVGFGVLEEVEVGCGVGVIAANHGGDGGGRRGEEAAALTGGLAASGGGGGGVQKKKEETPK